MLRQVPAGALVAGRGRDHARPVVAAEQYGVRADAVVGGDGESVRCGTKTILNILVLAPYLTTGSSSKVWNGGGELTCHSSVVAPSPQ